MFSCSKKTTFEACTAYNKSILDINKLWPLKRPNGIFSLRLYVFSYFFNNFKHFCRISLPYETTNFGNYDDYYLLVTVAKKSYSQNFWTKLDLIVHYILRTPNAVEWLASNFECSFTNWC